VEVTKDSIDLGIVVRDPEACRKFYGEVLGFPFEGEMSLGGGTQMYRYRIGTTVLKLVKTGQEAPSGPSGIWVQSGLRYFTISVRGLPQIAKDLEERGVPFAVPLREIRPGVQIAIVADPEGNMVELLESAG
jgi:catechol 2,3-dioxygenase-like lactoylglutathione lyase family enzyme